MTGFADYVPRDDGDGREHERKPDVEIRPGELTDIEAIAAVQARAGRPSHPDAWRRVIGADDRCLLVATVQAEVTGTPQVIGWAQTHHHTEPRDAAPPGHYLGGVTVDPGWRRRGVAVALTEARMRWIGERAHEALYVVNPANRASIDLHRRWGFEEILRAERLTGVSFSDGVGLLMRASLS